MKVGMDGMPLGSLLKIEDNPLLVMDHAIALGFEGVLLGNHPHRARRVSACAGGGVQRYRR